MTRNVHQLGLIILDQFNFHQTLAQTPGVSLIFFSSEECGSCRHWKLLLTQYLARHPGTRIFEVDARRDMALTREFDVFHLPALFLFVDGEFHCVLQSEADMEKLHHAIGMALADSAQDAP